MNRPNYTELALSSREATASRPFMLQGDPNPSTEELWKRYRQVQNGPSDLEALLRRMEERFEHRSEQLSKAEQGEGKYEFMSDDIRTDNVKSLREARRDERRRLRVLSVMLDAYLLYGEVWEWDDLPEQQKEDLLPKNTLNRYKVMIRALLSDSETTYGSKTELYRAVDDEFGNSGDACRGYLNRNMEDEPDSLAEWRKRLDV